MSNIHPHPGRGPLRGGFAPLTGAFWRESLAVTRDLRTLVTAALMIGLYLALDRFSIQLAVELRLSVSFVALALCGMLTGPVTAGMAGFACDVLGYFLFPRGGGFFPGYTLSTVLAGVFYGVFLFRQKPVLWRCFAAKGLVNLLINIGLGTLWISMITGKGFVLLMPLRAMKNALLWPVEAFVLMLVTTAVARIYRRAG